MAKCEKCNSKVLNYLIGSTIESNIYIGTYEKISKEAGVSLDTARRSMKALQEKGFVKKIQNGAYEVGDIEASNFLEALQYIQELLN